jgi:hypothetical protein
MPKPNEVLEAFLAKSRYEAKDTTTAGKNISCIPELKIAFDGYAEDEATGEQTDASSESYAIYISKNALKKGFVFPEHEATAWAIVHRPEEEFCAFAWLNNDTDSWDFPNLDWPEQDSKLTFQQIEKILNGLYAKYFEAPKPMKEGKVKIHNYTLIFKGRYSLDIRIDSISEDYLDELRNTPDDELFNKMYNENYGDELCVYGINAYSGYIEVFNGLKSNSPSYEDLGKPIITLHGDAAGKMGLDFIEPSPQPNSLIAGCVTNQDGIMGHIDLQLNAPFDVKKLSVIYTSASNYEAEGAITGIRYKNGEEQIEEYIDGTYYLDTTPKSEIFYCSRFDENLEEIPLYENGEWVD